MTLSMLSRRMLTLLKRSQLDQRPRTRLEVVFNFLRMSDGNRFVAFSKVFFHIIMRFIIYFIFTQGVCVAQYLVILIEDVVIGYDLSFTSKKWAETFLMMRV